MIDVFLIIFIGLVLRFYGVGWGTDSETGYFHRFHTDESTLIESTQFLGDDIYKIRSSYGKAPMYILWAGVQLFSPLLGYIPFDFSDNATVKFTYL